MFPWSRLQGAPNLGPVVVVYLYEFFPSYCYLSLWDRRVSKVLRELVSVSEIPPHHSSVRVWVASDMPELEERLPHIWKLQNGRIVLAGDVKVNLKLYNHVMFKFQRAPGCALARKSLHSSPLPFLGLRYICRNYGPEQTCTLEQTGTLHADYSPLSWRRACFSFQGLRPAARRLMARSQRFRRQVLLARGTHNQLTKKLLPTIRHRTVNIKRVK